VSLRLVRANLSVWDACHPLTCGSRRQRLGCLLHLGSPAVPGPALAGAGPGSVPEEFTFHGQHVTVTGVTMLPTPLQQPRIPIWCGGRWPNEAPFRRASCRLPRPISPSATPASSPEIIVGICTPGHAGQAAQIRRVNERRTY